VGVTVEPPQIRLVPGADDPYIWKILPEERELFSKIFSKNISDHSIRAYKKLCEGVGATFEAEPVATKTVSANAQDPMVWLSVRRIM
jgi:hypothetical protein